MKKPKLREIREAIHAVLRGPYTSNFPAEVTPVPEGFRGRAEFHEDECIGCKACAEVCPADAIEVVEDLTANPPVRRLTILTDRCIWCGHCQLNCVTKLGVQLGSVYNVVTLDRSELTNTVEKELVLCEDCGGVVACRDHIKWIADKIGAKTYANASLLLVSQQEMSGALPPTGGTPGERVGIMRVLCPACQRAYRTREIWG
jgi:hydrogenase-4 component H